MKINRAMAWLAMAVLAGALLSACGGTNNPVSTINSTNYSFSSAAPKFAIVGNDDCFPKVNVFSVDAATGALTELPIPKSPFPVNVECPRVWVHPNGKWVYITDYNSPLVEAYSIDNSGNLTQLSLVANTGFADHLAFSGDGKYLFTADYDAFISAFKIDSNTGALTNVGSVSVAAAGNPVVPFLSTITTAGNYLYAGTYALAFWEPYLFGFTVNASGNPVSISGSPWVTPGVWAGSITADWNGSFLYAGTVNVGSGNIQEIFGYKINSNGSLTALTGPSVVGGSLNDFIQMVFEPRNKFLYIADDNAGAVWAYSFDSTTGALTKITGSPFTAGTSPRTLAVDPSAKFLYLANYGSGDISGYTINQNTGVPTPMSSTFTPSGISKPYTIAFTH